jgi:hypothetical protein
MLHGRRIYLVDTPGFNDTNRPDVETLRILAAYLAASYANGVRIHGLIFLHPISDNRMTGSSLRTIEMMKGICGFDSYHNSAIATTMWPREPDPAEKVLLEHRNAELLSDHRFFGDMVARGAKPFRHNEKGLRSASKEAASARLIVNHLIRQSDIRAPEVLRLQKEIWNEGKTLGETTAGIAAARELYNTRCTYQRQLQELEAETNSQLAKADTAHASQIRQLEAEVTAKLKKAEEAKRALQKSMAEMHRDEEKAWKQKIKALDEAFYKHLAEKEQELQEMEESRLEIRRDLARRSQNAKQLTLRQNEHTALQTVVQEEMVANARREVAKVKGSYRKFKGQTGNILNGATNGLAAGLATGIITGETQSPFPLPRLLSTDANSTPLFSRCRRRWTDALQCNVAKDSSDRSPCRTSSHLPSSHLPSSHLPSLCVGIIQRRAHRIASSQRNIAEDMVRTSTLQSTQDSHLEFTMRRFSQFHDMAISC